MLARPRGVRAPPGPLVELLQLSHVRLAYVNYGFYPVGRRVDLDDLLDAAQVATLLGLSSAGAISVYQSRYADFPEPAVSRQSGRCRLWLRGEIEAWARRRQGSHGS